MFAPSKAIPVGTVPTAKVPSTLPVLASSLVTFLLPAFVTQMLAPSKAKLCGVRSHDEGPEHLAVARPQLGYGMSAKVRHPDVGPVTCYTFRVRSHDEGPQYLAVTRPQLGHAVAAEVCHPDGHPLNTHAPTTRAP